MDAGMVTIPFMLFACLYMRNPPMKSFVNVFWEGVLLGASGAILVLVRLLVDPPSRRSRLGAFLVVANMAVAVALVTLYPYIRAN